MLYSRGWRAAGVYEIMPIQQEQSFRMNMVLYRTNEIWKRYSCQRNTQTYFIQNLSCSHEIFSSEYSLPFNQFHLHYYGRLLAAVLRLLRKKYCSLEDKPIFLKCTYVFTSCSILIIFNPSLSRTKESSYKYSKHFIMRSYLYIYTRQFICICIYRC